MTVVPQRRGPFYWKGTKPYVSVTNAISILDKPALRYWFGREIYRAFMADPSLNEQEALQAPYKKSKDAKSRGTTIHTLIEAYKQTGEVKTDIPDSIKPYMEAFKDWLGNNHVEIVESEKTLYSEKYGYAGTADLIVKINGSGTYVVDTKTGKDIYPEVALQLSAYKQALEENGTKIDGMAALLLETGADDKPTGKYKFATQQDYFEEFLACKKLWEWMNQDLVSKYYK